jgi:hypothetical protein
MATITTSDGTQIFVSLHLGDWDSLSERAGGR